MELHVKDNGVGMSEEEQQKLFKLFSRIHENNHTEGTGMGLYNLKNMLEKYEASIDVFSEKGEWTEFVIYFA
jgi:signal transduction histidine kinase